MQLSCLPVSFFGQIISGEMSLNQWARMARELGLDAIDVSILFFRDTSRDAVLAARRQVEDAGMSINMISTYPDFTHPDAVERERELGREQEAVAVASWLGCRYVRVVAGQAHPETGREEGIRWAIEGMRALVETTRGLDVRLVYENHGKPGAWTYTDFSQPPDIFLEIARAVVPLGIGINFDTANATAFARDPVALLNEVIDDVVTVHAADTAVRGELQHCVLGEGLVPFLPLFARLREAGWDGWMSIEENARRGREGVERSVEFVRRAWAEAGRA
ncbi:MAG: sugar phosphate isomerase/epimerase [Chloroflexi bacterium]|nr:sugar phosphate isomerase/epimerase [Chloroflexota bacterium]